MSLLIFDQQDSEVVIITDTLVSTADRRPVGYAHKLWTYPDQRMVLAMTGTAAVGDLWNARILELIDDDTDIESIATRAQAELTAIHRQVTAVYGDHGTSTIYMWGFARGADELVRYVHRSKLDYAPERGSGQAFGHKPRAETFAPDLPETRAQVIELAIRLKQENDDSLSSEPVAIGGDLIATHLTPTSIEHQRWHRFPDHEEAPPAP